MSTPPTTSGTADGLLLLVDAHALLHRSYHALPPTMRTAGGEPTNALYGFSLAILKTMEELHPTHVAVCFDSEGPTLRVQQYADYKANRQAPEEDLAVQLGRARDIPEALGIARFFGDGHEADDYLGTLAEHAKNAGLRVVILTGDRDMFQLVDERVSVNLLKSGVKDTVLMTPAKILEVMGFRPDQVVDYKALRGDPSDNIPGVPGIGDVTATKLLLKHQTLDALYAAIDAGSDPGIKGKVLERLLEHRALAYVSRELARIKRDIPMEFHPDALVPHIDESRAIDLFSILEFRSLFPRLRAVLGTKASLPGAPITPPVSPATTDDPSAHDEHLERVSGAHPSSDPKIAAREFQQTSLFGPAESAGAVVHASPAKTISFTHHLVRTEAELAACVATLQGAGVLSIDTETPSLNPLHDLPCGISLAVREDEGYYLNLGHDGDRLSAASVQRALLPILSDPLVTKVGHNLKFDLHVLANMGLPLVGIADTLLMAYLIAPGARQLSLEALALQEFRYVMQPITDLIGTGKKQISFATVSAEAAAAYSVEDAIVALRLHRNLRERLEHSGQLPFLERFELPLVPILAGMERAGALLDTQVLTELGERVQLQLREAAAEVERIAGHAFNLNSPKQVSEVLFGELQLPTKGLKRTPQGEFSTAAEELEKLDHPIAEQLLAYRELEKLRSTYIEALPQLLDAESRLHTSYNQAVAATGRLSSSDPNLQNIPVRTPLGGEIRRAFIAPQGSVLIAADYSQIELRVLAHLSNDPRLIQVYREGRDIHAQTGAFLFNVAPDAVTKEQRSQAKTVNFGILYGMGPRRLARENKISLADATAFIDNYFASYPEVSRWMDRTLVQARQTGYAETLFGRRRYLPDLMSARGQFAAQAERMAVNHPIQGTAADIMKLAMVRVHEKLATMTGVRMILQVHDELVLEAPESQADDVARLLREAMEGAASLSIPLTVDVKRGKSWGTMN